MKKNAVITGANRGIGLSLTKHYLAHGWHVYAACRRSSEDMRETEATIIEDVDVSDGDAIKRLTHAVKGKQVDLLINNAGVLKNEQLGSIDYDAIRTQFEVNTLGPLRVSEALANNLCKNAKVVMITSRMGSIADNTSGGRYGYRISKAALNIAAVSLAHDLKAKEIAVAIIHPGLVGTDMIGGYGDITPDQAAERIAQRVEELTLENSGSFWHSNGEKLPW